VEAQGIAAPGRGYASLVYDPVSDRLLLYGGAAPLGARFDDLWQLSLAGSPSWSELRPDNAPLARAAHSAVFDATQDRMLVFGSWERDRDLRVLQWDRDRTPPAPLPSRTPRLQLSVLSNPSPAGVTLAVGLVENGDVRVELVDVAGRSAFRTTVPSLGPGPYVFTVAQGIRSGIYWVRARQGAYEATARAVVVR
jgi:hypothetical protein